MAEVEFVSRGLQRCYENFAQGVRTWGQEVARKYILRINLLYSVRNLEELYTVRALRLHPLKGPHVGQYAMTIHGAWRLIVSHTEGGSKIRVEEVTKHYGD